MSERDRIGTKGAAGEGHPDPREERLRALLGAGYLPLDASQALRQRVTEAISQHQALKSPYRRGWLPMAGTRAGAVAAALLVAAGFVMLARVWHDRSLRREAPQAVNAPSPKHLPKTDPRAPGKSPRLAQGEFALHTPRGESRSRVSHSNRHAQGAIPRHRPAPSNAPAGRRVVDDLTYLNRGSGAGLRRQGETARQAWSRIEAEVRRRRPAGDDFVTIPLPQIASTADGPIATAVAGYKREAAIVDSRLSREVTLAMKGTALVDLCGHLREETGIQLMAGRSVADEKVTLFCKKLPLRDVMRQLSRPFGYTWLRTRLQAPGSRLQAPNLEPGARSLERGEAAYRYELVQDLRSQLMEEELRNRDRNEALLALDQEMQVYRPYLGLSPDEALTRSKTAPPAEKKRLEYLAGGGWGLVQLYFRLSPGDLADLRAGQRLTFSPELKPDLSPTWRSRPLPVEMSRPVLQTLREWRIRTMGDRWAADRLSGDETGAPEGLPLASVPEVRGQVSVELNETELGRFSLSGGSGFYTVGDRPGPNLTHARDAFLGRSPLATAIAPAVRDPRNAASNARLARHPALRPRVTVQPRHSCRHTKLPTPTEDRAAEAKVTSADVLEALHQATGLPIVADYYTHLYASASLSTRNQVLFDTLNQLADTMHLRWSLSDGNWLQFRSASFFHDRLKEVPNRLLSHWAAVRREHGALPLDTLLEIAQLSDAQLDAVSMAEGARLCFGLEEWEVTRPQNLRPHLRYLSQFTPAQRQQAQAPKGLPFGEMTLAQQQSFLAHIGKHDRYGLEELSRRTLQVEYTRPGEFRWVLSGWRSYLRSRVRERTQAAALQAARRIDPDVPETQIVPTRLDVTILYAPADETEGQFMVVRSDARGWIP